MRHDGRSNIERPRLCQEWLRLMRTPLADKRVLVATPILGMLLSAAAFLLFTCFDTASKFLSRDYSVFQIMSVEFVTATVLLVAFAFLRNWKKSARETLRMQCPRLHLWRGIFQIAGQSLTFLAIPHLSLAEFYVIIFCMPIITVLKVGWFLKERAAAYIWPVLALNFIGVLIALRPDRGANFWALAALAGTFFLAAGLVILRRMMESETVEMAGITSSSALALGALVVTPFVYKTVELPDLALMVLGGALFVPAQIMLTIAFRIAPAALASPPQFLQLVYGATAGYFVFGDVPGRWIYVGGAIVLGANAFLLYAQQSTLRGKSPVQGG
ncbi:MAG: DMT family transporter [Rhodomicrobium sp.]